MPKDKWSLIAREYVVSLFPARNLADSLGQTIYKVIGVSAGCMGAMLKDHAIWWVVSERGWARAHFQLVRKIELNPSWYGQLLRRIVNQSTGLIRSSKELSGGNLLKLSSFELFRRYEKFDALNQSLYDVALACPLLDYQAQTYLSDRVRKLAERLPATERAEAFTVLTTPSRETLDAKQERELLRLFGDILSKKETARYLSGDVAAFARFVQKKYPSWWRKLRAHTRKYAALPYVYEGPPADENYFIDYLRDWLRRRIDPRKLLDERATQRRRLEARHAWYESRMNLSRLELQMVRFARDTVFVKPYRRQLQSMAYYEFEPVLSEIARRLGLSVRQVRYLLPVELKKALLVGRADAHKLNERIACCVYTNRGGVKRLFVGRKAQAFWKIARESKPRLKNNLLTGTTACAGRASGTVCIVNTPEDMIHMKPGNVLVSFATSPNLMPAIRQASAIVTDEGGLTSHAAIVSREMRIPCVVGTGIATKVLRNGMHADVDAAKAIVRIIKR